MDRDLVIFDCDGVLIDTEPLAIRVEVALLAAHGIAVAVALRRGRGHTPAVSPPPVDAMRLLFAFVFVAPLLAGCTPYLPMKSDFGTTAAVPKGDIPPEYAGFNAYDPNVNPVLAKQLCATGYQPNDVATSAASPGQLVTQHGTCAPHRPLIGN